jgi:hypothetical protein
MIRFLLVSMTGWLAVFAVGVETALPYIIRNTLRPGLRLRVRMWPHFWLGYALVALILAHTSFVMGPAMARSDATGIWAATLALGVLFLQVGLGLVLKGGASNTLQLRRWHFWSMIILVALLLIHIWRNG